MEPSEFGQFCQSVCVGGGGVSEERGRKGAGGEREGERGWGWCEDFTVAPVGLL